MRLLVLHPLLAATLLAHGCSDPCAYRTAPDGSHHYFDCAGSPLPQWEFIWDRLFAYFGAAAPPAITVEHRDGSVSRFSPAKMSIELAPGADRVDVVAHESTHLCNYNLTQGASVVSSFRFVDEGFAEFMGFAIAGAGDWYRTYALAVAAQEMEQGRVSLAQVQDWPAYFGSSSTPASRRNWKAYQVGSSFDFMLEDTRGAQALRAFFVDLGRTYDLGATAQALFASTASELEQEWLAYLGEVELDRTPPAVTALSPPSGAIGVPLGTTEITATFNVPMGRASCLVAPCGDSGLCAAHAYWKTPSVLAIRVDGSLEPDTTYALALGCAGCPLTSYVDLPLPPTEWRFTTAAE